MPVAPAWRDRGALAFVILSFWAFLFLERRKPLLPESPYALRYLPRREVLYFAFWRATAKVLLERPFGRGTSCSRRKGAVLVATLVSWGNSPVKMGRRQGQHSESAT